MTNNNLHYLDIENNEIRVGTAKSYNTEENYYPGSTEKFLADEIETSIGQLRRGLADFEEGKAQIALSESLTQLITKIFVVQSLRVPDFAKDAHANSVFSGPLGLPEKYYSTLHHNDEVRDRILSEVQTDMRDCLLKGYSVNILEIPQKNRNRSLLIPSSHFTVLGSWLILVLSPYWGIVMLPLAENDSLRKGEYIQYLAASEDQDVDLLNQGALKYERLLRQTPMLVGLKPELLRMKQYLRKEKEKQV